MAQYYTYILTDAATNTPFYIGKGTSSRMYQHKRDALNPSYCHRSMHRKIQSIYHKGNNIKYEQIMCTSEEQSFAFEIHLIEFYGRRDLGKGLLRNLTDGGEGSSNQNPESIEKRAAKHRGMKRSDEAKERMRQAQLEMAEKRREKYGQARSPESIQKQSDATKGRKWSKQAREVVRNKPTAKIVLAYKKDDGSFIGEYESISVCGKKLGCDVTSVWNICEGVPCKRGGKKGKLYPQRSCNGYSFKYKLT